jgi:hypothetical protein
MKHGKHSHMHARTHARTHAIPLQQPTNLMRLFGQNCAQGKNFYITIGNKEWEIPFESWYLAETDQTCVQPSPEGMQGLLVGDVFFRQYVVEFDMTGSKPIIGIAPLNKAYQLVQQPSLASFELDKAPKSKLTLLRGDEIMYPAEHSEVLTQVDRIPIVNKKGTQYFMNVGIGTPRQEFTVIFDTGSTVFGVFANKQDLPGKIKNQLPGYYFSENLHSLAQVSATTAPAPWTLSRVAGSPTLVSGIVAFNVALVGAAVAVASRRRGRKGAALAPSVPTYGTV